MCSSGIRETPVLILNYFDWRMSDFNKLMIFWKVYKDPAAAGDGDVEGAAQVNVHDALNPYTCMIIGYILIFSTVYYACRLCEDQN